MKEKSSFVLMRGWVQTLTALTDEQAGKLIKTFGQYELTGDASCDDPMIAAIFAGWKDRIDENDQKWEETKQKRHEAAVKRWSKQKDMQVHASALQCNANDGVSVSDSVSVSESVSVSDKDIRGKRTKFVPPSVDEVRAYCKERNNDVDPEAFVNFYASKGWMIGKNRMKDWKAAVRTWEKNRKGPPLRNQFNEHQQQNYDIDDLERRLLDG